MTNNRSNTMNNDQWQWTKSMWPLNKDQYCPQWPRNNYQWQWTKKVANEQWPILSTSLTKDCKEQWANSLRWFDMWEGRWIRQNDAICVCILELIYAWFDLVLFHKLSCNYYELSAVPLSRVISFGPFVSRRVHNATTKLPDTFVCCILLQRS